MGYRIHNVLITGNVEEDYNTDFEISGDSITDTVAIKQGMSVILMSVSQAKELRELLNNTPL